MSRMRRALGTSRILMMLALGVGGATFIGALLWLPSAATNDDAPTVETTAVLVAVQDLSAGIPIETGAVRVVQIPVAAVASGALTGADEATGRMLRYPVAAGEQILASKFVDTTQASTSGLAFVIPAGMRAVSVPLSEISGAGGLIVPGDRVDVLAAVDSRRLETDTSSSSTDESGDGIIQHGAVITILQDTLVLAIGQSVSAGSAVSRDQGTQRADEAEPQPNAASVTLAVSPEQAQTLFMAVMEGSIGLALRPFGDTATEQLTPVVIFTNEADRSQVAQR